MPWIFWRVLVLSHQDCRKNSKPASLLNNGGECHGDVIRRGRKGKGAGERREDGRGKGRGSRDEGKVLHNLPVAPWKVNYRLRLPVWGVKSGLSSRWDQLINHPTRTQSGQQIRRWQRRLLRFCRAQRAQRVRNDGEGVGVGKRRETGAGFDRKQALSGAAHLKANARGRAQFCTAWWSAQVKASGEGEERGKERVTKPAINWIAKKFSSFCWPHNSHQCA